MALSADDCDEMIAACQINQVKLGVVFYRRFYPLIKRIRQIIDSGEIGKTVVAQINAFEYFDPTPSEARFWLLEKQKSGGGPMMDFGCHRLEVLTNLFGQVSDLKSIVAHAAFEREVEDTATVVLNFASGLCANLTVTHAAFEPQDTLDIFATRGSIHVPVLNQAEIRIKTTNGERTEFHVNHQNVHQPLIADFTQAVLENREPQVSGETGRLIALLEDKIYLNKQFD